MAGNSCWDLGGEWSGAGFNVAEMPVEGRQWSARADDAQIDGLTTGLAKIILRRVHQSAAQAGALPSGINAKQSQIAAISAKFDVNTSGEFRGVFRKEKLSFFHVSADAVKAGAVAIYEGCLHPECGVDEPREHFHILALAEANSQIACGWTRIRRCGHTSTLSNWVGDKDEERLSACSARTDANFFMNRGTYHRQYLIRNINHAMHGRDVIRYFGQNLIFGVAARFELAPGNQIIAIKDFRHCE